jgi:glutamate racemase
VPDAIMLGCTHFPLIADEICSYFDGKPIMIHSGEAIVEYLEDQGIKPASAESTLDIFASDNVEGLREIAGRWLNISPHTP